MTRLMLLALRLEALVYRTFNRPDLLRAVRDEVRLLEVSQ